MSWFETTSATLVPPSEQAAEADLSGYPLPHRLRKEIGPALTELVRRIRRLGRPGGGSVVLFTGCRRGVGCSTLALALAATAAAERSVVLIDADLSQPGLSSCVGERAFSGWEEAVLGDRPFEAVLRHIDPNNRVAFLPLGQPAREPGDLLARPGLPALLGQLREHYGLILLDAGPVHDLGAHWAPWADLALVVCASGQTLADDWARAWDCLEEKGTHVLGIVETLAPRGASVSQAS